MSFVISLVIGVAVGVLYGALDFRSPAPPTVALIGLLGMQLGEKAWPWGKQLINGWLS